MKKRRKRTFISVTPKTYERIMAHCKTTGLTIAQFIEALTESIGK